MRSPLMVCATRAPGRRWTLSVLLGSFCVWLAGCAVSIDASLASPSRSSAAVVISSRLPVSSGKSCLGYLIAPQFVVASSECLIHEFRIIITRTPDQSLVVTHGGQGSVGVAHSDGPSGVMHGGSFTVLKLEEKIANAPTASLLALQTQSVAKKTLRADVSVATLDASGTVALAAGRVVPWESCANQGKSVFNDRTPPSTQWMCVDVDDKDTCGQTPTKETMVANKTTAPGASSHQPFVSDGFLVTVDEATQRELLWGLVWTSEAQCDAESAGTPRTMIVNTVWTIYWSVYGTGCRWMQPPLNADGVLVSPQPPSSDSSSGSSGNDLETSSSGSISGIVGEDAAVTQPLEPLPSVAVPEWLQQVDVPFASISTTNDSTQGNTTLGFFVTSRHLVLPRLWFDGNIKTLQYVTTAAGVQHPILNIVTEADFYANDTVRLQSVQQSRTDLIVIEIEKRPDSELSPIRSLVSLPPREGVVHENTKIMLFDDALKPVPRATFAPTQASKTSDSNLEGGNAELDLGDHMQSAGVVTVDGDVTFMDANECSAAVSIRAAAAKDPDVLCANATAVSSMTSSSYTIGLAMEDQKPVGMAIQSPTHASKFAISRLASSVHRNFLDSATSGEINWETDDVFDQDAQIVAAHPAYKVTLYATNDSASTTDCSGILVAPSFILTTASCLNSTEGGFSNVSFMRRDGDERRHQVQLDFQIPNPLYESPEDFLFDVAVIGLSEPVLDIQPVTLNPGYPEWVVNATVVKEATRRDFGGEDTSPPDQVSLDCAVPSSGNATNGTIPYRPGKHFLRRRGVCISSTGPSARFRSGNGDAVITKTRFGAITASGFQISAPSPPAADSIDTDGSGQSEPLNEERPGLVDPGSFLQLKKKKGIAGEEPLKSQHVYLSFADNANFINGYASGVNWGQRREAVSVQVPSPSAPSYVVGLRITRNGPNFCSGTLIASSYVLTAAHCVGDAFVNFVEVVGDGHTDVLPVRPDSIVVHPDFGKKYQFSYDAAVLELDSPSSSHGLTLDRALDYASKTPASMYGFGARSTADLEKASSIHTLELPLYSRKQCSATLPDIDDSMLCAGGERGQDACQGDSGGPLVLRSGKGDILVGVVSAGYGCGLDGVPGIYARASSLVNFVQSYVVGGRFGVSNPNSPTVSPAQPSTELSMSPANESRGAVDSDDLEEYSKNAESNKTSQSTSPQTQKPGYEVPIKAVDVVNSFSERVRAEFLAFLMGDSFPFIGTPDSPLHKLMDPCNDMTLYSRGDLSAIVGVLKQHNANVRHNRKDRFGRGMNATVLLEKTSTRLSAGVCQGH